MAFDFASDEKLLDIESICKTLSISRTTFERLRKAQQRRTAIDLAQSFQPDLADDYGGMPPFPEPTIMLGRSPRWSTGVLNKWIASGPVPGQLK